jgi:transaldolase / glucose-6-phosphate isomerase
MMGLQIESLGDCALAVSQALQELSQSHFMERLWKKDASLWKRDPAQQRIISNSLGWLNVTGPVTAGMQNMKDLAADIRQGGFSHIVLLGMGGGSLVVEVFRMTFGRLAGFPELHVLDSTDPATIQQIESRIGAERSLFIVASKSGTTVEVSSFYKYFFDKARKLKGEKAGEQFMAITDPGTALERIGKDNRFRHVVLNPSDIGGRFSALSYFGMVPAALMGIDIEAFLSRADAMVQECRLVAPIAKNPGVRLGVALAELARKGRDKLTFVVSPAIASFGIWVEQLLAESTGKEGKGLVPVEGEPLDDPKLYSQDRVFVYLRLQSSAAADQDYVTEALENNGQPVIKILLDSPLDLGAEFFRWEIATAVASSFLGINAFDQPNVQESKDNTRRLLDEFNYAGRLPQSTPILTEAGVSLYCDESNRTQIESFLDSSSDSSQSSPLASRVKAHIARGRAGDYLALMAYIEPSTENHALLQRVRKNLLDRTGLATTLGYGPRFLHSTGQLHKGGPNTGVFLQITANGSIDLPISGESYTFGILKQAQALGDFQSLVGKNRRVIRLHLDNSVSIGLERLLKIV